jgi:hypothetical protein
MPEKRTPTLQVSFWLTLKYSRLNTDLTNHHAVSPLSTFESMTDTHKI